MLDKHAKKVWCDALRSGEFKQTTGALRVFDKYCCLGVACKIFPHIKGQAIFDVASELTPESLKDLGLTERQQRTLIIWNDIYKKSFKQIANFIETYY